VTTVYGKEEVDVSLLEALLDQEATLADATPWNLAGFRKSDLGLDDNSMLQVE
jgi:hypothetical protein